MEEAMPEIYKELDALQTKLENHYRDMQDMEFTVQEGNYGFCRLATVNVPEQLW